MYLRSSVEELTEKFRDTSTTGIINLLSKGGEPGKEAATPAEIRLYQLGHQGDDPERRNNDPPMNDVNNSPPDIPKKWGYVDTRSRIWTTTYKSWSLTIDELIDDNIEIVAAFIAMHLIYGGFHLLAWNGPFRSQTQLTLWRIAAVAITSPVAYFIILFAVYLPLSLAAVIVFLHSEKRQQKKKGDDLPGQPGAHPMESVDMINLTAEAKDEVGTATTANTSPGDHPQDRSKAANKNDYPSDNRGESSKAVQGETRKGHKLSDITKQGFTPLEPILVHPFIGIFKVLRLLSRLVLAGFFPLYVLSRGFIVVECYISLFFAPESVFQLPNWAPYFLHLAWESAAAVD
jgi:hypothetical protein